MQSVVLKSPETDVEPGLRGFLDLCRRVGFEPEAFQRKIAKAALGPERELLILLPGGNGKTSLQALVALHHLLTVEDAEIFCCASSRDQARILFQYAQRYARELDPTPTGVTVKRVVQFSRTAPTPIGGLPNGSWSYRLKITIFASGGHPYAWTGWKRV